MLAGAVGSVVHRELLRFVRQRGRLLSTFARPLLWLVVVGSGFEKVVPAQGTVSYKQFLLPGIFGMVVLFSTMLSALATVHDREFGPIRMLLVAPLPRPATVVAKTISSTLLGIVQSILLLWLVWVLGLRPGFAQILELLGAIALCALAMSALGMLLASRLRSIENFAAVMNFVMFPMFFLSAALYPAAALPGFLQPFVRINPLTYGIDLMRHPLLAGLYPANLSTDYTWWFDVLVLAVVAVILLVLAGALFGEEDHLARILLSDEGRRGRRGLRSASGRTEPSGPGADAPGVPTPR
jgi:ABC-2 type transport system permease protein